jgi:hypothetical protein
VLALVLIGRMAVAGSTLTRWYTSQIRLVTGLDQLWIYDEKYAAPLIGVLVLWGWAALNLPRKSGARPSFGPLGQACLLTAIGIFVFPTVVQIPGYKHMIAFVADRMSLAVAVLICAMLAAAPVHRYQRYLSACSVLLFFAFLFRDGWILNRIEVEMARAVSTLSPGQRVISSIDAPELRIDPLTHMIDRVCTGRCFSYANYEPGTAQFRIRVTAESPLVISNYEDSWRLQTGIYAVKPRDLPLYDLTLDQYGRLTLVSLPAGAAAGMVHWNPL